MAKKKKAGKKAKVGKKTAAQRAAASDQDAAIGRHVQAAFLIKQGLTDAIKDLKRQRRAARIADKPWFTQGISSLRDEFAEVQADLLAFLDENTPFTPPTQAEFGAIKQMAEDLDRMIANAVAAKTILNAATKLADSLQS